MPPRRQIRSTRGKSYSKREIMDMVDVIAHFLPTSPDEWEEVLRNHSWTWKTHRSVASLRKKFGELHKTPKPTGKLFSILCWSNKIKQGIQHVHHISLLQRERIEK